MRRYMYKCGILQSAYDRLVFCLEDAPQDRKDRIGKFLQDLYDGPYKEYKRVRELPHITEAMWHQYEVLDLRDLPEQVMLRKAREAVRKFWKAFIKKEKAHVKAQTHHS